MSFGHDREEMEALALIRYREFNDIH